MAGHTMDEYERRGAAGARDRGPIPSDPSFTTTLLDKVNAAVIATDISGVITFWNKGAEELYGWTADEALGSSIAEMGLIELDLAQGQEIMAAVLAGDCWSGEWQVRRKDGAVLPVHVTDTALTGPGGDVQGIVGVSWDISQRKADEEKARAAEVSFRAIFKSATIPATVSGSDRRYLAMNPAFERLLGYGPGELIGKSIEDVTHPEDAYLHQPELETLFEKQDTLTFEKRYVKKSGEAVWAEVTITPIQWPGEPGWHALAVVRDVTRERAARMALQESEERFRALFAAATAGVAVVDDRGRWVEVNPAFERLTGYSAAELRERTFQEITHPDDIGEDDRQHRDLLNGVIDSFDIEKRYLRKDGSTVWVRSRVSRTAWSGKQHVMAVIADITESKKAREALRASEERFRLAFEDAHVGMSLTDGDHNILAINKAFCDMLGYSREEFLTKDWGQLTHPDDREVTLSALDELTGDGPRSKLYEKRYLHKDGSAVWARVSVSRVSGEDGAPLSYLGIVENITTAKQDAARAELSEKRLQNAFEGSHVAILLTGAEGTFTANRAFEQLFGRTLEEVIQLGWERITYPGDPVYSHEETITELGRRGQPLVFEKRYLRPDGAIVWARVTNSPISHQDGGELGYLSFIEDVTEAKLQAQGVEALERRFRASFENALVGMALTRADKQIIEVNDAYCSMLGYSADEIKDLGWAGLAEPKDHRAREAQIDEVLGGGEVEAAQYTRHYIHKNGRDVWAEISLSALRDAEGRVESLLSIAKDVTERVEAEKARESLQAQLLQAQKMEAVGQLAGGVAHDFNNLLFIIQTSARFLSESLDKDDERSEDAAEVLAAANRGQALVRQLLSFSRKDVAVPKQIDLNEILIGIERLSRQTLTARVDLHLDLGTDLHEVMLDPQHVEQVLLNLLVNARDAIDGSGSVWIKTRSSFAAGHATPQVVVSVKDDGCGMDAMTVDRIFEPFFTTKEKGKGTGLGLATAYGIIERAGGAIKAASTPGAGTCFEITLPGIVVATDDRGVTEPEGERALPGNGELILLAEDESPVRALVSRILGANGYEVVQACSGREAIDAFQRLGGKVDLVLTDVVMPQLSGRDVADYVKSLKPGMNVLYMSGYPDDVVTANGLRENESFMSKPFKAEELLAHVRDALDS